MIDQIYYQYDMAKQVLEKVFKVLGITIKECKANDCLNPCRFEDGACLKCFSGVLKEGKRLDICDACVV